MRAKTFVLVHERARANAIEAVRQAADGLVVTIRPPTRTLEQNAKLWAMLADVSAQVEWHGRHLGAEDWKNIFTASLRKSEVVPGIDAGTLVPLGLYTSLMDVHQMSDLIELIYAFGAGLGVQWSDEGGSVT